MDHRGRREHFGNLPLASRSSNPRRYLLPPLQTDIEIMGLPRKANSIESHPKEGGYSH
jgi:hypothetical protein